MPFFAHSAKYRFSRQKVFYHFATKGSQGPCLHTCSHSLLTRPLIYSQSRCWAGALYPGLPHPTQSSKHFESGGKMAAAHSSIWMQISLFLQPQCPIKGGCSKRSHLVTVLHCLFNSVMHCVVNCVLQNKSNHGTAAEAEPLELAQMWFKPAHCCCTFVYIPLWGKYYVAKIFGYLTDLCNKFMRKRVGFVLQYCSITPLQYCRLALDCALLIAYCSSTVAACVMHCRLHCNSIAVVGV